MIRGSANGDRLRYTFIDESDLDLEKAIGVSAARDILKQGLQILKIHYRENIMNIKTCWTSAGQREKPTLNLKV